MKILVPVKRVADPDRADRVRVDEDGLTLSTPGLEFKPCPFDEYAVETALRILDDDPSPGEVVVISIGSADSISQIRQCLAMGAHRGIHIEGDDDQLDARSVAALLTQIVNEEKADLVLTGKQAVDSDSAQVPQMLATLLRWPGVTAAGRIEMAADRLSAVVHREMDSGVLRVRVQFPAVISVDLRVVSSDGVRVEGVDHIWQEGPRFATLRGVVAARKKPVETRSQKSTGAETTLQIRTLRFKGQPPRRPCVIVADARELVARLISEKEVI